MARADLGNVLAGDSRWRAWQRRRRVLQKLLVVLAGLLLLLPVASPADAQTQLTVDSTLDEPDAVANDGQCVSTPSGRCTLRAAVQEIDTGGTVTLPAGLYVLTIPAGTEAVAGSPPDLTKGDLDITSEVTIIGASADRTVIDGNNDHRIIDIHAPAGFAHISKVGLRNGRAEFSGNTFHQHGGIIHNHGRLELSESTVSNGVSNAGVPWGGGGITNAGNGTATLRNVTIARNSTSYFGGGIENGGALTLSYTTLSENTAPAQQGGGMASGVGFFQGALGTATVQNTVVAGNSGDNCRGPTIVSAGHNLENTATCPFINTGDQFGVDPQLAAVLNNFGSIFVFALQPGSPAIDKASPLVCVPTDERGVTRPQEGDGVSPAFCDIGAYERAPTQVTCDGQVATIVGTAGDDDLLGTEGPDVIVGLDGDDEIRGQGGADRICGGLGRDELFGGNGKDRLFGQEGNDTLRGGNGPDFLDGGADTDRCSGGRGRDTEVNCEG